MHESTEDAERGDGTRKAGGPSVLTITQVTLERSPEVYVKITADDGQTRKYNPGQTDAGCEAAAAIAANPSVRLNTDSATHFLELAQLPCALNLVAVAEDGGVDLLEYKEGSPGPCRWKKKSVLVTPDRTFQIAEGRKVNHFLGAARACGASGRVTIEEFADDKITLRYNLGSVVT